MELVSGVTSVMIDGVTYAVDDSNVKFEVATRSREAVVSKGGTIFTKETPLPAKLSFSIFVPKSVDVSTFNSKTSANIVVVMANGMSITGNSFAQSGNCEYDSNEGKLALEFFGQKLTVSL